MLRFRGPQRPGLMLRLRLVSEALDRLALVGWSAVALRIRRCAAGARSRGLGGRAMVVVVGVYAYNCGNLHCAPRRSLYIQLLGAFTAHVPHARTGAEGRSCEPSTPGRYSSFA